MACRFWSEIIFNIRIENVTVRFQSINIRFFRSNIQFFRSNVRLFYFNVRFFYLFERATDVQCPIMKRMVLVQKEIAKEYFKKLRRFMNTVFQVIVVCPDQRIPKIPCILSKNVVRHVKAQRAQILDEEYCRRSGVALSLCQVWDKNFLSF